MKKTTLVIKLFLAIFCLINISFTEAMNENEDEIIYSFKVFSSFSNNTRAQERLTAIARSFMRIKNERTINVINSNQATNLITQDPLLAMFKSISCNKEEGTDVYNLDLTSLIESIQRPVVDKLQLEIENLKIEIEVLKQDDTNLSKTSNTNFFKNHFNPCMVATGIIGLTAGLMLPSLKQALFSRFYK